MPPHRQCLNVSGKLHKTQSLIMKNINIQFLLLAILQFLTFSLFAQKHFNLNVQLPHGINIEKVEAWLEDGKAVSQIIPQSRTGNQLILTGDYYSIYAAINLQYIVEPPARTFANTFYIQEKPALIKIYTPDSAEYPFANYSLENALDFKKEKRQMEYYVFTERQKALDYEHAYGDKIFGGDTAIRNPYMKLMESLRNKKLQYIVSQLNSYYSFYIFREDVAKSRIISADSLLMVFNAFPDKFKYTDEGNYLNQYLHGKQAVQNKGNAIDFTTKDINKKKVTLSDYNGEKYVLLHFWATWCTPCMKEIPAMKEISEQYKSKDLQIISIALPSSKYADYLTTINKLQMNWINVYNDDALQNRYGNQPTPRLCLVDKTGKVIYDIVGVEKNDFQLNALKEKLKEVIGD
jgi:thiol-disulfide isomerase/thioredoxin